MRRHGARWLRWASANQQRRTVVSALLVVALLTSGLVASAFTSRLQASNVNMLVNGNFEGGFSNQPGYGVVGTGWTPFTNDGAAVYSYQDEQWAGAYADGAHSQLIQVTGHEPNRCAGVYQVQRVVDWLDYTVSLKAMLQSTEPWGDAQRNVVLVGWTFDATGRWQDVKNWQDIGLHTTYAEMAPGPFHYFATPPIMAESDYITLFVQVCRSFGSTTEKLSLNLDTVALTGPPLGTPAPMTMTAPSQAAPMPAQCSMGEFIRNGGFEQGFSPAVIGVAGTNWGSFTNGGAAGYGFYDEQWSPVVAEGTHGQLIEINAKGISTPDKDRYAGIYQRIGGLTVGATYELSLRGGLRGAGNDPDPYRFVAEWGWTSGADTDWMHVTNWRGVDLGSIYDRTSPGPLASFKTTFQAPATDVVIFIRGWKKWGIAEVEMDLNLDAISLKGCAYAPTTPPTRPPTPPPGRVCTYTVRPGDTLGTIAKHHGVRLYDLAYINGISNIDWISVGQVLTLPGCVNAPPAPPPPPKPAPAPPPPPPPPPAHVCTYMVQPGDTLGTIAAHYGVWVHELAQINGIQNVNWISVGQVLMLPGCSGSAPAHPQHPVHHDEPLPAAPPPPPPPHHKRTHTIAPGESLGYLCDLYGVDVWTIAQANGIVDVDFVYVGQVLVIP